MVEKNDFLDALGKFIFKDLFSKEGGLIIVASVVSGIVSYSMATKTDISTLKIDFFWDVFLTTLSAFLGILIILVGIFLVLALADIILKKITKLVK